MAERPVFIPILEGTSHVRVESHSFQWHPGFAVSQKKKCITSLHKAAAAKGLSPLLEVSTKSDEALGRSLSAFNLELEVAPQKSVLLECVFQGSKVFEEGGPFRDLYDVHPKAAKRDPRLRSSGRLTSFSFGDHEFPLEPKTVFYDWLYINAVAALNPSLAELQTYKGFTDIEFNPNKSINCQARALATYVALAHKGLLTKALENPTRFIEIASKATFT